jgi:hypothetical protein
MTIGCIRIRLSLVRSRPLDPTVSDPGDASRAHCD